MAKTSIIEHGSRMQLVIIREDYLSICDNDHCSAAILNVFEYWTNIKLGQIEQTDIENGIKAKGEIPTEEADLWIYKTIPDLKGELLGLFGERSIATSLARLKIKEFLLTRNNPKFGWDRTIQYLFLTDNIRSALLHDASGKNAASMLQKGGFQDAKRMEQYHKTTSETPSKTKSKKVAPVGADFIPPLIKSWLDGSGVIAPNAYGNKTIRTKAQAMHEMGITPDHITAFIKAMKADKFWASKGIDFEMVCKNIVPWLNRNQPQWNKTPDPTPKTASGAGEVKLTDFGKH